MTSFYRAGALLAVALLLAALSHIGAILLFPTLAGTDDWTRLASFGEPGKFVLLPTQPQLSAALPRSDPMMLMALCRYDLDETGSIRVSGSTDLPYWGLSAHNRHGMTYYAINNRGFGTRALSLRVMSQDDVLRFRADLPEDAEQELLVAAPEPRGFVLVRALIPFPSARPRIETELGKLSCQAEQP